MSRERSFSLIRTNPLLTGNVKFVVKSNGDFHISPIPVNDTLHDTSFIRPLSSLSSPFEDISKTFGKVPTNILYDVPRKPDGFVYEKYSDMVDQTYLYKVSRCTSMLYDEEFSVFAPLLLGSKLPKYFIIYKSRNGKRTLKDCDIVRIIDLENSPVGQYFRNHTSLSLYNNDHIDVDFIQRHVTYTGISIDKSSIVQISESFDDFVDTGKSVYEFDKWITDGFLRHRLVSHKVFNLEFLFDDESETIRYENYFGLYANDVDLCTYSHSDINTQTISSLMERMSDVDLCLMKSTDSVEDLRHFDIKKHDKFVISDIINVEKSEDDSPSYNELILDDTRKPIINTSIKILVDGKESETIYSNTLSNLEDGDYGYKQWSTDGWLFTYYNPFGEPSQVLQRICSSLQWVFDALRLYGVHLHIDHENKKLIIENLTNPHIELVIDSPDGTLSLLYDKFVETKNNFTIHQSDISKVVGKYVKIGGHYELVRSTMKRRNSDGFDIITDTTHEIHDNKLPIYTEKMFTFSCVDFLDVCDFDYLQTTETKHNDILPEISQYSDMDMRHDPDLSKFTGYESYSVQEKRPLENIPLACKWVSEYKDVRGDEYRLNISEEFGKNGFTPSFFATYPNPKFFTHEFFNLSRFPLVQDDYRKMSSYFPHTFDVRKYCFSSSDYFEEYFTRYGYETKDKETGLSVYHRVDKEENWSIIRKNKNGRYTTIYRGVSMTIDSEDDIDGYRFANILNINQDGKSDVRIVRNRKFRNIVLICNISYNDYKVQNGNLSYLNLYTMGSQSTKTSSGIIDGTPIDYSSINSVLRIVVDQMTSDSMPLQRFLGVHHGISLDLQFISYTESSIEIDAVINGGRRKLKDWYSLTNEGMFMEIVGLETDIETGRKNLITFRQLHCDDTGVYLHHSNLTIRDFDHSSLYIDSAQKLWTDDSHNMYVVKSGCCIVRYGKTAMESVETFTPKSLYQYVKSIDPKKSELRWYLLGGGKNYNNYLHEFVNFSQISEFIENNNVSYTERQTQDTLKITFNRPVQIGNLSLLRYGGRYNPKLIRLSSSRHIPDVSEIIRNYNMSYLDSPDTFISTKNNMVRQSKSTLMTQMAHPEFVYATDTDIKKTPIDIMEQIDVDYDRSSHFDDYHSFMGSLLLNLPNSFMVSLSSWDFKDGVHSSSFSIIDQFIERYESDFMNALSEIGYPGDMKTYVRNFCGEKLMSIYKVSSSTLFIDEHETKEYTIDINQGIVSLRYKKNSESIDLRAIVTISLI